ncbi:MAG: tetratricopeptide repeat protein [Acidobacteriota bacterium]
MRGTLVFLCLSVSYLPAQPSDANLLQRYFEEGERALAEKRYAEAAKAYEKLRQLDPQSAEVQARLGLIYFQQGSFAQAVPALQRALKLKPDLPNARIIQAMSLSELGRYQEALPGLEFGFRQASDSALRRLAGLHLQRAYTGLQRDSQAVEVALQLMRLYPEDPEVLYHSSRLYANFAYLTMRKLSEVASDSVWMHQAAGDMYESQGSHELAITEYRHILALDPGRPGVHFRLGRALVAHSQRSNTPAELQAEAMTEFERELHLDPTNANAAYELAEMHRKRGQLDKAHEFFQMALTDYPDFEEAQIGLGRVLMGLGKPDLALAHLRKALSLNPENEVPYYQLSQVHKVLGNTAEQQRALAEFLRLRNQKSSRRKSMKEAFSPREVTRQEVDSEPAP